MKCPNCNEALIMTERQGIEVDYCPSCRGVWLDKGELDKILERSGQIQYGDKSQSDYYDRRDDDYYKRHPNYHHKKKRGFLGDFFDFD